MVERLQYAWTPEDGLNEDIPSLTFRSGTDEEFLDLFTQVAVGSLDVATTRGLTTMSPVEQARDDLDFYLSCPGEREWWRVALGIDGDPVGFAIPSATPYRRNVGYLGVLPAFRGRGLVDALLHEIMRFHAESGARRVAATTDVTNAPMAAALHRAHFTVTEIRLMLDAPGPGTG